MAGPFIVNLQTLFGATKPRSSAQKRSERRAAPLPGLVVTSSFVPEEANVIVDLILEAAEGGILATGSVEAPWTGECRRCLVPVNGTLNSKVRELFEENGDPEQTYQISNGHIDLEPLARDAVLVELPVAPLCSPGCKGLCPTCGVNWNNENCACSSISTDPRWRALDSLRGDV